MPEPVPLSDQADEVEREIRQRERLYPGWIAAGRLRQDTAEAKLRTLRAAAATLRFMETHATGLRALAHFVRSTAPGEAPIPTTDERAALLAHPGVQAVLDAWPDAELVGIGGAEPIEATPQADLFQEQDA